MNALSVTGATIVTLALISYSIGIISEQVKRKMIPRVLIFITLGVVLDITATIFMILGSKNSPFTSHGFIGYSALFLMLIESIMFLGFSEKCLCLMVVSLRVFLLSLSAGRHSLLAVCLAG